MASTATMDLRKTSLSERGNQSFNTSFMQSNIPGPGQYELKSVIGSEGPKRSFGLKYKWEDKE